MKKLFPWILAGAFFVAGVVTLADYGMHEDSPFHFLRGQYFLERLLGRSGKFSIPAARSPVMFTPGQRISAYKPNASEELFSPVLPIAPYQNKETSGGRRVSIYKNDAWTDNIWDLAENQGHPAVSDMLMAAVNRATYEWLGILSDVDGYQVYSLIVVSVALVCLYFFVEDAFGRFAAVIAVLTLAMYPTVFAESHFNIKDTVQMAYYTMAVVSWYFTVTKRLSVDWLVLCIVSVCMALGTKWNILFAPFILAPWTIVFWYTSQLRHQVSFRKLVLYGVLVIIIPFILLILAYPFYWTDTVYKLLNTFSYYATLAVKDLRVQKPSGIPLAGGLDARAMIFFFSMSPPGMLMLALVGAVGLAFRKYAAKKAMGLLIALWFIIPFLRVIWQVSEVFGSVRHYMEFLPAFAVLVGVGSAWIVKRVKGRIFSGVFLGVFILLHAVILVRFHPYEHLYFNSLVGGIRGAQSIGLYTWETLYDAPYRELAAWLNAHAEKDARLAHLDGTMFALSPAWLRPDIRIGSYFSGFEGKGEYIASIIYPKPPAVFPYHYLETFVKPVYEVKVGGVVIAKVWKNDTTHIEMTGTRKIIGTEAMRATTSEFRGADQVTVSVPGTMRILNVSVLADDVRCITQQNLVWSVADGKHETYMVPWISQSSDVSAILSFPGMSGSAIRFWDISHTGCAKVTHVIRVEGLQ